MNTRANSQSFFLDIIGLHTVLDRFDISSKIYAVVTMFDSVWTKIDTTIGVWHKRSQDRAALAHMSRSMLQDIGIDSVQAQLEANKPFWKE